LSPRKTTTVSTRCRASSRLNAWRTGSPPARGAPASPMR